MAANKKLTIDNIGKRHNKEFNEKKKLFLKTGDYVLLDKKFKASSIQKMLSEYIVLLEEIKKKGVTADAVQDVSCVYYMLLLRHFTNLDNIPNDIEAMVQVCEKLIDLDILDEIILGFEESELNRIDETIQKIEANGKTFGKAVGEILIKEQFESDEKEILND